MVARQEVVHSKKLEQALRCHEKFPINLEWMVDVFKYKHISSLTTHLKRHFKVNVHYKRHSQEQNKRVWTYFINVECFIGICEYVRHATRKKIANIWLRKAGKKVHSRRMKSSEDSMSENEIEEDDDEEEEGIDEEDYQDELSYDSEDGMRVEEEEEKKGEDGCYKMKWRRMDDDDEFECDDEEEDNEERTCLEEMEEEEEEANGGYCTDDSVEYESASSREESLYRRAPPVMTATNAHSFRNGSNFELQNSSEGTAYPRAPCSRSPSPSPPSSCPSSPSSSETEERQFVVIANCTPTPSSHETLVRSSNNPALFASELSTPQPIPEQPVTMEMCKEIIEQSDWSYLHLHQNPHPLGHTTYAMTYGPQYYLYPNQAAQYAYVLTPNGYVAIILPGAAVDHSGYAVRNASIDDHCELQNMDERQFDPDAFLSFPEEHHYQQYPRL